MSKVDYMTEFLDQYAIGIRQNHNWNQYQARPLTYNFSDKDVAEFNAIYKKVKEIIPYKIIRTNSGGIAKNHAAKVNNQWAWDISCTRAVIRLTVLVAGRIWVFRVSVTKNDNFDAAAVTPISAWLTFKSLCKDNSIDLDSYKIENGKEVKETISKPKVKMLNHMSVDDEGLTNVHHIDFHNSYPAGLCNKYPEFRSVIEPLYNERHDSEAKNKTNKAILNYTIGAMQSLKNPWKAQWAHLSKAAIEDNNERINLLAAILQMSGRKVIGYNTDGIWYQGRIYWGKGMGPGLGQWNNDHINCTFRCKSDGAYEFIEDGKYYPVIRGCCQYDAIKDRSEWQWGDIYRSDAEVKVFTFDDEEGIIINVNDDDLGDL